MNRLFIKQNLTSISIILFVSMYFLVHSFKPSIIYNKDGTFRNFGIGYKKKTILPIWLFVIFLSIFSYTAISYYQIYPRIEY